MAKVLMPLPSTDFDPTETAVPWRMLTDCGHQVLFATPDGAAGQADTRMLTGQGLGVWAALLRADSNAHSAYTAMTHSMQFQVPLRWGDLCSQEFDAVLLPGGHAPGMKTYLESVLLQARVADFFAQGKPVGAICHGVVLAARSRQSNGLSVLHGRNTTALTRTLEMTAWLLTHFWLGDYYRTYPETVQDEVTRALGSSEHFHTGPLALLRDDPKRLGRGFTVRDGNYLSARWPGDAHRFASDFCAMLTEQNSSFSPTSA